MTVLAAPAATPVRAPERRVHLVDIPAAAMVRAHEVLTTLGAANEILAGCATADPAPELANDAATTIDRLLYVRGGYVDPAGFDPSFDIEARRRAARLLEGACLALPAEVVAALDVLIRRARDPYESLITFAPETLLDADVAVEVRAKRIELKPVDDPVGHIEFGADADYTGMRIAIIKLTRLCNLRCTYCNDWSASPSTTMDQRTRMLTFEHVLREGDPSAVSIVWHGGEPTTVGRREILATLWLQRYLARPNQQISNVLQTNATRIDQPWAEFFATFGFTVGASLDGPKEFHDVSRPGIGGRPSFDRAVAGIGTLRAAGVFRRAVIVVTAELAELGGASIIDFLREVGIDRCALLPVRPQVGEREPYLELDAWANFLIEVDVALGDGGPPVEVRELTAIERTINREPAQWCELQGNCQGTIVSVEADGSIGHCDKYVGDERFTIGSLHGPAGSRLGDEDTIAQLKASDAQGRASIESCQWSEHCRGWCPHEREVRTASGRDLPSGCCGLGLVYDHIAARGTR